MNEDKALEAASKTMTKPKVDIGLPRPTKTLFSILQRDASDGVVSVLRRTARTAADFAHICEDAADRKDMGQPLSEDEIERMAIALGETIYRSYVLICSSQELQPIATNEFREKVMLARSKRG